VGDDGGVVERWRANKLVFLKLTEFFLCGDGNAETCWTIFCQMTDASRQQTRQGQELLLATVLEAILRSLYKLPFQERKAGSKNQPYNRKDLMEKFRTDFFPTNGCRLAIRLWRSTRDYGIAMPIPIGSLHHTARCQKTIKKIITRINLFKPILRLHDSSDGGCQGFTAVISSCAF
jgi:hypothetical protein